MGGLIEDLVRRAVLHDLARVHHGDAVGHVGHHAHVVGDEDDGEPALLLDGVDELQNLRLNGHVQRGGRLVADQDLRVGGQGDGDDHALPHAAGQLEGVLVEPALRIGDAHSSQQLQRPLLRVTLGNLFVEQHGLGQLLADLHDGVQAGQRVLEDHAQLVAAVLVELILLQLQQIHALIEDGARAHHGVGGQDAHQRPRRDRLAGAGFAHDGQRLALVQVEVDAPHRAHHALVGAEGNRQVLRLKDLFSLVHIIPPLLSTWD